MVDASPLIYLAKLAALDTFEGAGLRPLVTPEVERETSRPGFAYEHPDSVVIAEALRSGILARTILSDAERKTAQTLARAAGGLDAGESEVLAAAVGRGLPVLLFERRATRFAGSLGIETWSPLRLLAAGTPDRRLLRERVLAFAVLVSMKFEDLERVLQRIEVRER
jgi:predicted nucleic acid-binding protein